MKEFRRPMLPWPALAPYGQMIHLPGSKVDLFYYDTGPADGAAILMVHGLGDEADSWRHILPVLARRHRVLAPDLPGFGRSSLPSRSLTPPFLVSVLTEFLQEMEQTPVLLIGSSLGGILCQEIALTNPQLAKGLILLDGTIVTSRQAINIGLLLFVLPGIGEWLYTRLRKNPQAAFNTLRPYYADLDAMPEDDRKFLFQRVNERVWSDSQRKAYFSILRNFTRWTPGQQKGMQVRLQNCLMPTLAIWGASDHMIDISAAEKLRQLQPTCRLVTIPDAGHLPYQERPGAVLQAIYEDKRLPVTIP